MEQALAGGLTFDAEGRPLVRSLRRWPLVAAIDVPPLSVVFVPSGDPLSRFGAGALAEAAGRAAVAAIAHAVAEAAGRPRPRPARSRRTRVLEALAPPAGRTGRSGESSR